MMPVLNIVKKIVASKQTALLALLFISCPLSATEASEHSAKLLYVISKDTSFYQRFTDNLQRYINTDNTTSQHQSSHRISSNNPALKSEIDAGHKLIVSIGSDALNAISKANYLGPHFSVLVPAETVKNKKHSGNYSALYVDHPASLYLKLIKAAMPKTNHVGILLGPSSSHHETELINSAASVKLQLQIKKITYSKDVSRNAGQLASDVDVMLALPDPVIHNSQTAQSILYAGYRHKVPVVAYSSSYLKAGALISLYSSPDQIAKNAAEHINLRLRANPDHIPISLHPSIFSIGINKSVSRSLGYESLNETELMNALITNKADNNE